MYLSQHQVKRLHEYCQKLDPSKPQQLRRQFEGAHFPPNVEDETQEQKFARILKAKGRLRCPKPDCTKSFRNRHGYEYHLERCGVSPEDAPKYYCPLCPDKVYICKNGLTLHQRSIHEKPPPKEEEEENGGERRQRKAAKKAMDLVKLLKDAISDPSDRPTKKRALNERQRGKKTDDFSPEDYESDNDDDEYEEVDGSSNRKRQLKVQTKGISHDFQIVQKMSYDHHCERLCSMEEVLFRDQRSSVSTWSEISTSTYNQLTTMSQGHLHVEKNGQSRDGSMTSLPLYGACMIKSQEDGNLPYFAFNIGGIVRSLAWCPVPINEDSADQYAAFSPYYSNNQVHQAFTSLTGPSCIQIWGFGPLQDHDVKPELKLCILHSAGNVHALKWCPSGCWDDPSSDSQWDHRLGLLAAACSDGSVLLYSIPHPTDDHTSGHTPPKVYKPLPNMVLWPGTKQNKVSSSLGPCLCLDWQQRNPHSKIAAGYACGSIAIWNLKVQSPLVRQSSTDDSITILPSQVFIAHSGPVLTISWSPADNNVMCSSGRQRMLHFWDIRQAGIAMCSQRYPNALQTCQWLSHHSGVLAIEDGHVQRILLQEVSSNSTNSVLVYSQQTHILDVTCSEWLNCLVASDISGKIELFKMPKSLPVSSKPRTNMVSIKSPAETHAPSVLINVDAVYKLHWNPNKATCRWLLAGGHSGIVQLYDVASQVAELYK